MGKGRLNKVLKLTPAKVKCIIRGYRWEYDTATESARRRYFL
jgi:hypothetical protein